MITLPVKINTTMLISFWIVFCSVSLAIISLLSWYLFESKIYLSIMLIIPIAILPGYLKPESITGIYKLFNRIIRKAVRVFRGLILRIIYNVFYFSFRPGREGKGQVNYLKRESGWNLKSIEDLSGYETINEVAKDSPVSRAEFAPMVKWIFKSKNWSVLPALPLLCILSFLSISDEKTKTAENTYTLY